MNIAEIELSLKELADKPFDPSEFPFEFLAAYEAARATITKLRQASQPGLVGEPGAVHLKKKLLYWAAEPGDAGAAIERMAAAWVGKKDAPRLLLCSDGRDVLARDVKTGAVLDIPYSRLNDAFDFFLPLAGIERYEGVAESPADVKATGRVAQLYDAILEANPDWRAADRSHSLNLFMTRLLFCFFAEDTSIFELGQFTQAALTFTQEDGSDCATTLALIFKALSLSGERRGALPEFARRFPYVNGGLFKEEAAIPAFSRRARRLLRSCGELNWSAINPDIFGSMIQAVVEPGMRGDMGMHYTSVPNIMKVLQPLFLLSIEEEFEAARDSEAKLNKLLARLGRIRVFDPACGSGNFLIIAYRELRKIESRIFARLKELGTSAMPMTGIHLGQFYGIELADFAAETAKLSLWIAEYQMNELFKAQFGTAPPALPLRESGNIVHGNALREDWLKVCPKIEGGEIYIVGNPPYLGRARQTVDQKGDMAAIFGPRNIKYKNLDFVACWTMKGAEYSQKTGAECAFVTTNSIYQGEQVALLWPTIEAMGLEIGFAHTAFKWKNNATKNAGVTCVIVGLRPRKRAPKTLYVGDLSFLARNINAYLIDYDDIIVHKRSSPMSDLPPMDFGSMPNDNGGLILLPEERDDLLRINPEASRFIRALIGSQEFIKGIARYCLWIGEDEAQEAMRVPEIARRVEVVRKHRSDSARTETAVLASIPYRFGEVRHKDEELIVVPIHFSEDRDYFTVGFLDGRSAVVSNACYAIFGAPPFVMALLSSRLHSVWVTTICGRIRTDIRYSNTLGYNTFPVPRLSDSQKVALEEHAWSIIAAREGHPGKTLGDLYDPNEMPPELLAAHRALDETLERMYIGRPFKNDTERLEHLFKRYTNTSEGASLALGTKGRKSR